MVRPEEAGDGDSDDGGHEGVLPAVLVRDPAEEVRPKQHAQHVEGAVDISLPVAAIQILLHGVNCTNEVIKILTHFPQTKPKSSTRLLVTTL